MLIKFLVLVGSQCSCGIVKNYFFLSSILAAIDIVLYQMYLFFFFLLQITINNYFPAIDQLHTGKCIRRFGGIYAYCRYVIDRKW